ncbi:hypothetical protein ZIOFF_072781 [Zingiber officinale]|uniref:Uncharacterized protein n=1 Tax=Zingiber officinale TaxID=94328 RepID=A0A8J5ESE8_ZINOF|nr:hypothetical protein ZIOFF_072781 [Zingiber officinale]
MAASLQSAVFLSNRIDPHRRLFASPARSLPGTKGSISGFSWEVCFVFIMAFSAWEKLEEGRFYACWCVDFVGVGFSAEFCATLVVVLVRVSVEEIGGVKGHFGPINAMAFNPDWRRSDGRISGRLSGRNLITNAVAVECCFVIEDMSIQVNVPALAMEEVAPLAVSDVAMLAPEEIFHGKGNIKEEAELTKEERKRRRANQKRRFRRLKAQNDVHKMRPIKSVFKEGKKPILRGSNISSEDSRCAKRGSPMQRLEGEGIVLLKKLGRRHEAKLWIFLELQLHRKEESYSQQQCSCLLWITKAVSRCLASIASSRPLLSAASLQALLVASSSRALLAVASER